MSSKTLSYAHGTSTTPLLSSTIADLLDDAKEQFGDREALACFGARETRMTFGQLQAEAERVAAGFLALGLQPGDRVGIWSPNRLRARAAQVERWRDSAPPSAGRPEWLVTMMAAAKANLILVSVNPSYRKDELQYALNKVGVKCLVTTPRHKASMYARILQELIPELALATLGEPIASAAVPSLERIVILPGAQEDPDLMVDSAPDGMLRWADVEAAGDAAGEAGVREVRELANLVEMGDPAGIQFTSGTTGSPKGVTLTHQGLVNNAYFVGQGMNLGSEDVMLGCPPLYHCLQQVLGQLAGLLRGAKCVYPAEGFDPLASIRHGAEEGVTAIYGTPTMYIAMMDHPKWPEYAARFRSRARTGVAAGSIVPIELMRRIMHDMGAAELTICYGMTETSPVSFQTAISDPEWAKCETVGRVIPHVEAKIVDPHTRRIVPRGVRGELMTRGYLVMKGYWNDDEQTAQSIEDGWMKTGDLGSMTEDGYVRIEGRSKDLVIRGGENISPREIEDYLYRHDAIAEVQVVAVPDAKMGEEVCAWVQLREGFTAGCADDDPYSLDAEADEAVVAAINDQNTVVTAADLRGFCKGNISHHKVPRYFRFVRPHLGESFPTTVTGKIQKYVMRDQAAKELGLVEEARPGSNA
ncbi:acsf2 [Symbiodinium sp. KB8]|nr:acsf2 [Symbiodinium sp. KB8]